MLSNPKLGMPVVLCYAAKNGRRNPLHGETGVVVISGAGGGMRQPIDLPQMRTSPTHPVKRRRGPVNHGVRLDDGRLVVVPAGNLNLKRPSP